MYQQQSETRTEAFRVTSSERNIYTASNLVNYELPPVGGRGGKSMTDVTDCGLPPMLEGIHHHGSYVKALNEENAEPEVYVGRTMSSVGGASYNDRSLPIKTSTIGYGGYSVGNTQESAKSKEAGTNSLSKFYSSATQRLSTFYEDNKQKNSEGGGMVPCSRRICCLLLIFLICLILFIVILVVVIKQLAMGSAVKEFTLMPPEKYRFGDSDLVTGPSKLFLMWANNEQAMFEVKDSRPPLKSNTQHIYDFGMNTLAIIDRSLPSKDGYQDICFFMKLEKELMPSVEDVEQAIYNTENFYGNVINSSYGDWQQSWQIIPSELEKKVSTYKELYSRPIWECEKATWFILNQVRSNQKDRECYQCYEFCYPDFSVSQDRWQRTVLRVPRLNCFYMNVPGWRQQYRELGGHVSRNDWSFRSNDPALTTEERQNPYRGRTFEDPFNNNNINQNNQNNIGGFRTNYGLQQQQNLQN